MVDFLRDIEEFHVKFGHEYNGKPRLLSMDMANFRLIFMEEEMGEWDDHNAYPGDINPEFVVENLEKQLDALVDLAYVLFGTAYLQGFTKEKFEEAWARVHRANMSKVRATEASQSKRGSSLDVVKPEGWVAPSHLDLVEDHAHKE